MATGEVSWSAQTFQVDNTQLKSLNFLSFIHKQIFLVVSRAAANDYRHQIVSAATESARNPQILRRYIFYAFSYISSISKVFTYNSKIMDYNFTNAEEI